MITNQIKYLLNNPKLSLILVSLITLAAYSNTLQSNFTWDDSTYIVDWNQVSNYTVTDWFRGAQPGFHSGVYRPLRNALFPLTFYIWGLNPTGYHLQAIGFHTINIVLTYLISRKITKSSSIASLTSILFALHPIQVESTSWITASFDLFGINLCLAAFYSYLLFQTSKNKKHKYISYTLASASFFANEICLVLPALITTHYYLFNKNVSLTKLLKDNKTLFLITALYGIIRLTALESQTRITPIYRDTIQQLLLIPSLATKYISQMLVPANFQISHTIHPGIPSLFFLNHNPAHQLPLFTLTNPTTLAILILPTIMLILIYKFRQKSPVLSFSLIWLALGLLPVLQVIPQPIIFSERYAYLSSFGLFLFLASLTKHFYKNLSRKRLHFLKNLFNIFLISLIFGLAIKTHQQNSVWKNNHSLWQHSLKNNPLNPASLEGLGVALLNNNQPNKALTLLQSAVTLGNPQIISYQRNLSLAYESTGDLDKAVQLYQNVLKRNPNSVNILHRLGDIHLQRKDIEQAQKYYQRALDINTNDGYALDKVLRLSKLQNTPIF